MTVFPSRAKFFKRSITCSAVVESRPVVGSSRKIILGLTISSTPIEVLFLYPPLIPLIKVFPTLTSAQLDSPNYLIRSSTILFFYSTETFVLKLQAKLKHSRGVNMPKSASSCITYPIWLE